MDGDYKISFGNMRVLQKIPIMMQDPRYRKKLRELYLEFMAELGHSEEVEQYDRHDKKCLVKS